MAQSFVPGMKIIVRGEEWQLLCDYTDKNRIDRVLDALGIETLQEEYARDVSLHLFVTKDKVPALLAQTADASGGSAILEKLKDAEHLQPAERAAEAAL